jgi:hypothetical protein
MSETNTNPEACEFVTEIESAQREARRRASNDLSSPMCLAYYHSANLLKGIVSRHVARGNCSICCERGARRDANHLGHMPPPNVLNRSAGVAR